MNYILTQIKTINGFLYPCYISDHTNLNDAMVAFKKYVGTIKDKWGNDEIIFNHPFHFSAVEYSNKGNAIDIQIYAEDFIIETIKTAVDISENSGKFKHIDVNDKKSYEIDINVLHFDNPLSNLISLCGTKKAYWKIVSIIKRPESPKDYKKQKRNKCITWLYDVHLVNDNGVDFVESLDCISYEILFIIYTQIYNV